MSRKKRVLRTRKSDGSVVENRPTVRKRVTRRVARPVPNSWGMTKVEMRLATPMPTRKDLTKVQWAEWGDALRVLKFNGYINADLLSLGDMRDALRGVHTCCKYRAIAIQGI